MKNEPKFGTLIKARRLELNITMDSLAKEVGISRATISAIENNDVSCSLKTILNIADALELDFSLSRVPDCKKIRQRASRTNTILSKKINRFIVMTIENFAQEVERNSGVVYQDMNQKGIIDDLKNDYEDLHGMSTQYLNEYINSLLVRSDK